MRLNGKSALVTGGASGFGAEIAATFAREGAKVTIMDMNGDGAEKVATGIGDAAACVAGDVTEAEHIRVAVGKAVQFGGGRLDIVVNNAGWSYTNKPILETTEAEFDRVYAVNVKSIFHMTQAVLPLMRSA